eukprot:scaffold819_cov350-Prasinococcus_capsulatus_cf.AAC.7
MSERAALLQLVDAALRNAAHVEPGEARLVRECCEQLVAAELRGRKAEELRELASACLLLLKERVSTSHDIALDNNGDSSDEPQLVDDAEQPQQQHTQGPLADDAEEAAPKESALPAKLRKPAERVKVPKPAPSDCAPEPAPAHDSDAAANTEANTDGGTEADLPAPVLEPTPENAAVTTAVPEQPAAGAVEPAIEDDTPLTDGPESALTAEAAADSDAAPPAAVAEVQVGDSEAGTAGESAIALGEAPLEAEPTAETAEAPTVNEEQELTAGAEEAPTVNEEQELTACAEEAPTANEEQELTAGTKEALTANEEQELTAGTEQAPTANEEQEPAQDANAGKDTPEATDMLPQPADAYAAPPEVRCHHARQPACRQSGGAAQQD